MWQQQLPVRYLASLWDTVNVLNWDSYNVLSDVNTS